MPSYLGYAIVIIILSVIATLSAFALFASWRRQDEILDRMLELEEQFNFLQQSLITHTHSESKAAPTIPQSNPIVRYVGVERKRRARW